MIETVSLFLKKYCPVGRPVLLALSGGPDSLCLFHSLLACKKKGLVDFHAAHVNHRWREISDQEAEILGQMVRSHGIPYYEKTLNPSRFKGNLEAFCRVARQGFFQDLYVMHNFQGVLTGHHQNDQAETILKRVLEGSYWTHFEGLKAEKYVNGTRFLRPLLHVPKNAIHSFLNGYELMAFKDPTNEDEGFLRARLRKTVLPWLNEKFGKNVHSALINLSSEMAEINAYFLQKNSSILNSFKDGRLGKYWDLQKAPPTSVEMKHLMRAILEREEACFSRSQIDRAVEGLIKNDADLIFESMGKRMVIDRSKLFILNAFPELNWKRGLLLEEGLNHTGGNWKIAVKKIPFCPFQQVPSWEEAWNGNFKVYVPVMKYQIVPPTYNAKVAGCSSSLQKMWSNNKVPSFLRKIIPILLSDEGKAHEFLTGKQPVLLAEGDDCFEVELLS
ncbi:MAG: tRNA lysidine(34) synthetase TilS [Candidatus Protochlamydia sp.]|nr:tRNA lysidine(34) synthetase TilS [Candidatus Protochlamydia sp.]